MSRKDEHDARQVAAPGTVRRARRRAGVRHGVYWAAVILGGLLLFYYNHIKHPPLALRVLAVIYGVVSLLAIVHWVVYGGRIVRDWVWLRWDDWRKWRAAR